MPSGKRERTRKPTTWEATRKEDAEGLSGAGFGHASPATFSSASDRTSRISSSRDARWQRDECSNPTVEHSSRSDRQRLPPRARITGASVRSRSANRTRPLYSRGDLEILFLSLGLGTARTGDCTLRPGRLLFDGRLVVFPATGQPQEAKAQQSKAQCTGEQPHDEYAPPQEWARRRLKWRKRDQM
jgi:hypothetical protein